MQNLLFCYLFLIDGDSCRKGNAALMCQNGSGFKYALRKKPEVQDRFPEGLNSKTHPATFHQKQRKNQKKSKAMPNQRRLALLVKLGIGAVVG
ncbi:MAG: hypothetical protein HUU01_01890 [Saprospiraceae bacterium]|nr:hypothetical protein [Saprospiraceae bacterium]